MSCASDVRRTGRCERRRDGFLAVATGYDGRDRQIDEVVQSVYCARSATTPGRAFPKGQGDISMTFHTPRWVSRSVPAAALGLALVGAVSACGSSGNPASGNPGTTGAAKESTSQICTDLTNQSKALESSILGSMSGLTSGSAATDPSSVEAQALTTVKTALTQLVGVLRADAGKASDSGLAKALNDSADALSTEVNKVNSVSDLETLGNDMQGMTALDKYCPDALSE